MCRRPRDNADAPTARRRGAWFGSGGVNAGAGLSGKKDGGRRDPVGLVVPHRHCVEAGRPAPRPTWQASAHVRRYGRGGSRGKGGLRRFREHAITLTAPPPDAGGRGSDLAGCTPGLGLGDWGSLDIETTELSRPARSFGVRGGSDGDRMLNAR